MIIGVPSETIAQECRLPLTPAAAKTLTERGCQVLIQSGAGARAGFPDDRFREAGATIVSNAADLFARSDLIVKVKQPEETEFPLLRPQQHLFSYLHTETRRKLVDTLLEKRMTAIAFENIQASDGGYPLLYPMSRIAGQQAVMQGMQFLWNHRGGPGISLIRYPGIEPARVVILGGGPTGEAAAGVAAAMGADVCLFEIDIKRILLLVKALGPSFQILNPDLVSISSRASQADLVINATNVQPNSPAHLIDRAAVQRMKKGSVIVDVTANLKGAIETIDRYTSHDQPVFMVDGVIHYAVPNIPGTVAHTATQALSMSLIPFLTDIADKGTHRALTADPALRSGLTAINGLLTWKQAAKMQNRPGCTPEEGLKTVTLGT